MGMVHGYNTTEKSEEPAHAFDGQVADAAASLIHRGIRPTVRSVVADIPGANHARTSGALRRFWRRTLSRIVGIPDSLAPLDEEPTEKRIAVSRLAGPTNYVTIGFDGGVIRVALPQLVAALEGQDAVHRADPSEGGGIVVFLPAATPVALRLSKDEFAFLSGKVSVLKAEDLR